MIIRTYSDLAQLQNFFDRYEYLRLSGKVGKETFGFERFLNQELYRSRRWRQVRDQVIIRDNGCDLGDAGRLISNADILIIHHMNPITIEQIENEDPRVYDPEYLICTSLNTHNAIHYGSRTMLRELPIERKPFDMCPWR